MASLQCHKPADQTCHESNQTHSLGQKVSDMAEWAFKPFEQSKPHAHQTASETQSYSQTRYSDHELTKTRVNYSETHSKYPDHHSGQAHGHGHLGQVHGLGHGHGGHHLDHGGGEAEGFGHRHASAGVKHKKKGLLEKIKDVVSGHATSSSSSSESDSDNEHSRRRKSS